EITLRGEILPIGGLKEKLLAAHRGGVTTVLIPYENEKDLSEIPENVKKNLDIKPVRWIDEVLEVALQHLPTPIKTGDDASIASAEAKKNKAKVVAH
ncbi:MAG: S16 family serine protease, partial [Methylococcales bacterium]